MDNRIHWSFLVATAVKAAQEKGYRLTRVKGLNGANVFDLAKDGKVQRTAIRTTRDRWIAFPPLEGGTKWKTLDDVEQVLVAAVDSREAPRNVEVYLLPAADVKRRFNEAYEARTEAGRDLPDNFGMWLALDPQDERVWANNAGSGIAAKYKPIGIYPVAASVQADETTFEALEDAEEAEARPANIQTIADVMAWAREQIARIAQVKPEAVRLDLKVEY